MTIQTKFSLRPDRRISFWDRSKHHHYLVALLVAELLMKNDRAPALIDKLQRHLENWKSDPSQGYALRIWKPLASLAPSAIAQALIATTAAGEAVRDTMPPIVGFEKDVMNDIIAQRRHEVAVGKAVYESGQTPQ